MDDSAPVIRLEPWTEACLSLLRQANTPEMTAHLGGPETEVKLLDRHQRYLRLADPGAGQMFAVMLTDGRAAGIIGYWERRWCQRTVYETGWNVLPAFQGRGIATAAASTVAALAGRQHRHPYLHAFPATDHDASNAVCRKAGFALLGPTDIEYPPGAIMRCNDWQLELQSPA